MTSTTHTQPQADEPSDNLSTERLALPVLYPHATPSRLGLRVAVHITLGTAHTGVVIYEDTDGMSIVEFDEGTDRIDFLHTCGGRVPSGRGLWCNSGAISVVTESQVETESIVTVDSSEPLTKVDVAEIWDAYRNNPTIDIDSWIAARNKLNAATRIN